MDYSPKWGPNCAKYLPVMQCFFIYTLLQPMSQASIFCHIKGLMKIHNRGKFDQYSICGCQVKIFSKFCKPIRHPWNGCFEFFCALTPSNMVRFYRNFHQRQYFSRQKQYLNNLSKIWIFTETGRTQNLRFRSPVPPEECRNRKMYIFSTKKIRPSGYPNMSKSGLYLLSPSHEKQDYFPLFLHIFGQKAGCSQRLKGQNQNLTQPILEPTILVCWKYQIFGSTTFQFCG